MSCLVTYFSFLSQADQNDGDICACLTTNKYKLSEGGSMKKWVVIVIVLFWWFDCDWGICDLRVYIMRMRNMSSTSGFILTLTPDVHEYNDKIYTLGPSHLSGIPKDTLVRVSSGDYEWGVARTLDSVLIGSGNIEINCDKWLLVEENNGIWSCTWSDTAWE